MCCRHVGTHCSHFMCRHAPRHTWREKVEPPSHLLKMHEEAASQEMTVRGIKREGAAPRTLSTLWFLSAETQKMSVETTNISA